MQVTLKTITPRIEKNIVEIARVSSSRTDKSENLSELINYLIKNKHWSPFEHGFLTLEIKTSKAIGIQLIRHRSFTFQEFSQRYAVVTDLEDIEFRTQAVINRQSSIDVIGTVSVKTPNQYPTIINATPYQITNLEKVQKLLYDAQNLYIDLIESGVAKECARMILPMSTETTIYMTGSIRSWIHLIMIRDDAHAQKEIQLIAKEMKRIFIQELPIIANALDYFE